MKTTPCMLPLGIASRPSLRTSRIVARPAPSIGTFRMKLAAKSPLEYLPWMGAPDVRAKQGRRSMLHEHPEHRKGWRVNDTGSIRAIPTARRLSKVSPGLRTSIATLHSCLRIRQIFQAAIYLYSENSDGSLWCDYVSNTKITPLDVDARVFDEDETSRVLQLPRASRPLIHARATYPFPHVRLPR